MKDGKGRDTVARERLRGESGEKKEKRDSSHCRLTLLMNSRYLLYFKHIYFFRVYYVHLIYPIDRYIYTIYIFLVFYHFTASITIVNRS